MSWTPANTELCCSHTRCNLGVRIWKWVKMTHVRSQGECRHIFSPHPPPAGYCKKRKWTTTHKPVPLWIRSGGHGVTSDDLSAFCLFNESPIPDVPPIVTQTHLWWQPLRTDLRHNKQGDGGVGDGGAFGGSHALPSRELHFWIKVDTLAVEWKQKHSPSKLVSWSWMRASWDGGDVMLNRCQAQIRHLELLSGHWRHKQWFLPCYLVYLVGWLVSVFWIQLNEPCFFGLFFCCCYFFFIIYEYYVKCGQIYLFGWLTVNI